MFYMLELSILMRFHRVVAKKNHQILVNAFVPCHDIKAMVSAIEKTLCTEKQYGKIISLTICGSQRIQTLNRRFRHQDKPTDVLSFSLDDPVMLGDIFIALPVAQRNARWYENGNIRRELEHLAIHGTLHLLGYDHHSDDEANIMERLETRILSLLD